MLSTAVFSILVIVALTLLLWWLSKPHDDDLDDRMMWA